MAIYEGDQNKSTTVLINGVHTSLDAAQLKSNSAAGTVYTFTATYKHVYNGRQLDYRKGASYALDPKLRAQLLALAAPMVAA